MTDMQNEVFKTPVNKIRLFEHGAPGSQNLKLTRKYYTEDMPDGRVKHIVQNITDPDIVPYIPDGIGNKQYRQTKDSGSIDYSRRCVQTPCIQL